MQETDQYIEIRNAPMQEIIGRAPGWMTTWGTTVVFLFLLILILFASVFKFPDAVKSVIVITTENPPANLMARASGNMQKLFVEDNQLVNPGDLLAIINNPANYNDVMLVRRLTDSLLSDTTALGLQGGHALFKGSFQVGEIQPNLSAYLNHSADYVYYLQDNPEKQRITAFKQELERYIELSRELAKQCNILKKELDLARKQHERDIALHASGTISDADLEKSESLLLTKNFSYGESKVTLANNRLQEAQVRQEIITLESEVREKQFEKERFIRESLLNLSAAIATWEGHYVLKAPLSGRVSFSKVWNENQPVSEGDLVMTVIPLEQGNVIGKMNLSMEGAGKVREGQRVVIKLDHYPYLEFGMLNGYVKSIAAAPNESAYMVQVNLKDSLLTTYGKTIDFRQEMQGDAEIITDEMTLMTRIMNPIRHIIRRHRKM
ncbi:MAG: HlyD family efflux transporter periplasmic adaptor subunit [Bacteroidales bacterium]|nr:HlyD family efflux transporter periplasmic adaptor subunit [Bacteroidales bacterium]MBN2762479.1 HlyD family efflux transporter periplasmic adaptor subunit [Bacteroidales bacterium]